MKQAIFFIVSLLLLSSCSVSKNERKARHLIEARIKSNLSASSSYDFTKLRLDSCFADDASLNPELIDLSLKLGWLYRDYKDCSLQPDERSSRKASAAKAEIIRLLNANKKLLADVIDGRHRFTHWAVSFNYSVESGHGETLHASTLFFLNPKLTEITHYFTVKDVILSQAIDFDALVSEFHDDLLFIYLYEPKLSSRLASVLSKPCLAQLF